MTYSLANAISLKRAFGRAARRGSACAACSSTKPVGPRESSNAGNTKACKTDRVVLVLGPDEEVTIVRHIYHMFTKEGKVESEIAAYLNSRGIKTELGRGLDAGHSQRSIDQ